jgi:hypothetical protein
MVINILLIQLNYYKSIIYINFTDRITSVINKIQILTFQIINMQILTRDEELPGEWSKIRFIINYRNTSRELNAALCESNLPFLMAKATLFIFWFRQYQPPHRTQVWLAIPCRKEVDGWSFPWPDSCFSMSFHH